MQDDDGAAWYLGLTPVSTRSWQIRLRWTTAAIEALILAVVFVLPELDLPLQHIAPVLAAAGVTNAVTALWLSRGSVPRPVGAFAMAVDIVLLSGLIELSGGPFNPFSVIYAVQIALAAVTLGAWWASSLGALAGACFGILVYWHLHELTPFHHRLADFPTHLFTMWVAAVTTAELLFYFAGQAASAVARREQELQAMRERAARTEHLVSLTTLAAGAAHELSTPLATIAVAARELERAAAISADATGLADARLIRQEVERCQVILDQMSGRAGGIAADHQEPVDVEALMTDVRERIGDGRAERLRVLVPATMGPLVLPRAGLSQVLASLVRNAFDASDASAVVVVEVSEQGDAIRIAVHDEGSGMPPEVLSRVGEPFYTTKEPGRGLGLGLFLARIFAERLGGTLTLQSGRGTTAVLELPRQPSLTGAG